MSKKKFMQNKCNYRIGLQWIYRETHFHQASCEWTAIDRTMRPSFAQPAIVVIVKVRKKIS